MAALVPPEIGLTIATAAFVGAFLASVRLSGPAIVAGAALGAIMVATGCIGGIILMPESNIAPVTGVFFAPAGFYMGGMGGFVWHSIRALVSPPRERYAYFIVFFLFALSPIILFQYGWFHW